MQDEHVPKLIPGFLVVCKACGDKGEDFARCSRCKRAIPEDAKRVPDTSAKVSGRTVIKEQLIHSVLFSGRGGGGRVGEGKRGSGRQAGPQGH